MTPLSVQRRGGGQTRVSPAAPATCSIAARTEAFAATPPAMTRDLHHDVVSLN
jgi:hypothetical protein